MIPQIEGNLPFLTVAQMIEVDRAMIEDYQIELIQMMENAGRHLARLAVTRFFDGDPRGRRIIVLAGSGGNGGGALVGARRLANFGAEVVVYGTGPAERFSPVAAHQREILEKMGVAVRLPAEIGREGAADLIIDGVIGYSLHGAPRGAAAELIAWANDRPASVLALDVPSGLNGTTGEVLSPAARAAATMTLALPKVGLVSEAGREVVGELYLADISVPPALYAGAGLGLDVGPLFYRGEILRIW